VLRIVALLRCLFWNTFSPFYTSEEQCAENCLRRGFHTILNLPDTPAEGPGMPQNYQQCAESEQHAVYTLLGKGREIGCTTLRRPPSTYRYYRGLPCVYPIFHIILPGEAEQQCAEGPKNYHTFGRTGSCMRLIPHIILRLEPRLFSSHTSARCTHSTVRPGAGRSPWYTQGGGEATYPGWCISSHTTRVCIACISLLSRVCSLHIPS